MNPAFRLVPAASPFSKSRSSFSKPSRSDDMLSLRQVVGSTIGSALAFDSLPHERRVAFTAGAAAVVATIDEDHKVTQRFFRAHPSTQAVHTASAAYGTPASDARNRGAVSSRDAGVGASLHGSAAGDWADSPGGKSSSAKDRIKAATCVAFSSDGKYIAVGETGYKPRILVFSTAPDAPPETPIATISEHKFGVRCVSFSPDCRYLASLGAANDGFLYIWSLNPRTGAATLHASNRCTNHINKMAWLGNSLVLVGTRHAKVWRIDEAEQHVQSKTKHREENITLPGRNCILGSLVEQNFSSIVAVSDTKALVSTEKGDICLLDDSDRAQRLFKVASADFGISALAADSNGILHIAGTNGEMTTMEISKLVDAAPPPTPTSRDESPPGSPPRSPTSPKFHHDTPFIIAMAPIGDLLVTVDTRRAIRLLEVGTDGDSSTNKIVQQLPAQGDAVLGVHSLPLSNSFDASFVTWSADGLIKFWAPDGTEKGDIKVHLEQLENCDEVNELRTIEPSPHVGFVATGDRYGVLSIIDGQTGKCTFSLKAHGSEITDIEIHEGETPLVVTSARDRTVQVFQKIGEAWDVLQTLDEHASAVTGVLFSKDGAHLLSCSTDRTVVVRDFMTREENGAVLKAFLIARTITLKSTPVSMAFDADNENILVVSTIDRQVQKYDIISGQPVGSFKSADADGGEAVVLSDLVHFTNPRGQGVIAGVSSTDKSVRIYDENGNLLGRDWGHTEGVTDIALISINGGEGDADQMGLVTVAVDGTIFIWNLDFKLPLSRSSSYDVGKSGDLAGIATPGKDLLSSRPPIRRVLSQSELAKYQRSGDDEATTPTGSRSPTGSLRKKSSKLSLHGGSAPKLEPSPVGKESHGPHGSSSRRHGRSNRSPSPPSPTLKHAHAASSGSPKVPHHSPKGSHHTLRRPSFGSSRSKTRSNQNLRESSGLAAAASDLSKSLRLFRKKLGTSQDKLPADAQKELERELRITSSALGGEGKTKEVRHASSESRHEGGKAEVKSEAMDEASMAKLLEQYSERLVELLDRRIDKSVQKHVRQLSQGSVSGRRDSDDVDAAATEDTEE
ncbi:Mitogen-activated protein kinase-binding protein 1 [Lasiodiplodia theobromae]|uniref:Mitogen-activated protein kinase-binding protein 1 n=1 Tax=Lasiodiplodia theobromae TaxID=45133 RepID=A0A5N5D5X6_9PEZI|nr:Mitogen-activated protein kinase-binding protein 1 [Lasiodiplodia theobromae]